MPFASKDDLERNRRERIEQRIAAGEFQLSMWLPVDVVSELDRMKKAGGFASRAAVVTALVEHALAEGVEVTATTGKGGDAARRA